MKIPVDHLINTCKYRKSGCCKYIFFSTVENDFCCAKLNDELKNKIDSLSDSMKAQGDNCPGISNA